MQDFNVLITYPFVWFLKCDRNNMDSSFNLMHGLRVLLFKMLIE